ncbi:MAG: hypothetical protein FWC25_00520, partial [Dehalococcoidia bacterium]|nr:hypothetical protein [Dehalococcoidia bacterium]
PLKHGYTFLGWTVTGGVTVAVPELNFSVSAGTTGDLYLTAHWQMIPEEEEPTPPKAGNNCGLVLWPAVLAIAIIGIVRMAVCRRKKCKGRF